MRKFANVIVLTAGLAVLFGVIGTVDLAELWSRISKMGLTGFLIIVLVYAVGFSADVASWQVVLRAARSDATWFRRLFAIRAIGEAYNVITPAGSMGGEPVKIWLLKRDHDISIAESSTSLLVSKTAAMAALTAFTCGALMMAFLVETLTASQRLYSGMLVALLAFMIAVFVVLQTSGVIGATAVRTGRARFGHAVAPMMRTLRRFDVGLRKFYAREKWRFILSCAFATLGWVIGVVEIYAIFALLGDPITFTSALLIEAAVQLVRTLAFVVPAGLGAQEAAMLLAAEAIVGAPATGVAAAVVRRGRELVWIASTLVLATICAVSRREP